jgi:tetratricopeptide (TPR) repeat protein
MDDGPQVHPIRVIERTALMNPKASAILDKACDDRRRSNFKKAIERLEEGVEKYPREFSLYTEAIDVGMEAGESLRAIQILKKAQQRFPDEAFECWTFAAEKVGTYNDAIMGRYLIEHAVKAGDFAAAESILENLKDHAVSDLLERIRIKKQTMTAAMSSGSPARGETASFTLSEALIALRLGRLQAAMEQFVDALEENPGTAKKIESFLADFESHHEGSGETSFALACCLIARGDYAQGIAKLARAARTTPPLTPRVIERIESLGESPEIPLDIRDLTLAQLYLGQGERARAARILKTTAERSPGRAGDAVDLLRDAVERIDDDLETQFIFVEAAFIGGRRETALAQLRKIHKDKRYTSRLVEWLESRTNSQSGSTEVQLFFAETALNEGLHAKAIEIYGDILSSAPQEEAAVRNQLSRHESVPAVRSFLEEKFGPSPARDKEKESVFELERCDRPGFPSRHTGIDQEPDDKAGETKDGPAAAVEPIQTVESLFQPGARGATPGAAVPSSDFDNRDFSLDMHEPAGASPADSLEDEGPSDGTRPIRDTSPSEPMRDDENDGGEPEGSDFFDYLKRHSESSETPTPEAPVSKPAAGTPAEPVIRGPAPVEPVVADIAEMAAAVPDAAPDSGAPCENDIAPDNGVIPGGDFAPDNGIVTGGDITRDSDVIQGSDIAPGSDIVRGNDISCDSDIVTGSDAEPREQPVPEPVEPPDFESLYRAYLDGRLDRRRIVETAALALDEGRTEESMRLLSFEPANLGEEIARKYQLARYYLSVDQPLPALVALRTVHLNSLSREERKDFLLRIAECYRALHNFDAAHGVYLRIMSEHPGLSEVESLARSNYARYVESALGAAAALEKTTTL